MATVELSRLGSWTLVNFGLKPLWKRWMDINKHVHRRQPATLGEVGLLSSRLEDIDPLRKASHWFNLLVFKAVNADRITIYQIRCEAEIGNSKTVDSKTSNSIRYIHFLPVTCRLSSFAFRLIWENTRKNAPASCSSSRQQEQYTVLDFGCLLSTSLNKESFAL